MFHELGHFLSAKLLNWKVDKIYIFPLGGITVFNDYINKKPIETFIVTIMGPIFQIIITCFFAKYDSTIVNFSTFLLLFNLLPIVPLDGSKLMGLVLNYYFCLKSSIKILLFFSYLLTIILIIFFFFRSYSIIVFISLIIIFFKLNDENKNVKYYYNKFLIERYLFDFKYKKSSLIDNINKMFKYRNNIFNNKNIIMSEKEYLKNYFSSKYNCKE